MARITQSMLVESLIRRIQDNFERLSRLQGQVSSGLRVEKPSDDPLSASRISTFQGELLRVFQLQSNVRRARARLTRMESVYGDVRALLREARQIAISGANDPSNDPREALASRVADIVENALNLANTQFEGEFLFSGSLVRTQPFTADSSDDPVSFAYNGNFFTRRSEVSFSRFMDLTQTGLDAFGHFAHTVIAGKSIENPDAPLEVALGKSFGGLVSFTINMGEAVSDTTVSVNPATQSLNDLVTAINNASAGVEAFLDPENKLVIRSLVEGGEGKISLVDGSSGGLLTQLKVADDQGAFLGFEKEPVNIFTKLTDLKLALKSFAFKEDLLINLENSDGQSLGLQVGDIIQVTANTASGAIATDNFVVGPDSTLEDLAAHIQAELRDAVASGTNPNVNNNGSETVIVRVRQGKLEIINPEGANSAPFEEKPPAPGLTIRAFDSSLSVSRTQFDAVMAPLEVQVGDPPFAVGESRSSEVMRSPDPAFNIANRIEEIQSLIELIENNQIQTSGKLKELELLDTRHLEFQTQTESLISEERDVDIARAIVELRQAEQVFQAALGAGARVINLTLLDFLR